MPKDPVIMRMLPNEQRFQYVMADNDEGSLHLVDTWRRVSDLTKNARFNADTQTQYHLFTR
jgi:hypothetical protein